MPLSHATTGVIPTDVQAVLYKFKIPDLADHFETFSPEQTHIALEGALNIIFGQPVVMPQPEGEEEQEPLQSDEENQIDHESVITSDVVFALFTHQQGLEADAAGITEMVPVEDFENTTLYREMEDRFKAILKAMGDAIGEDSFNQDVITLFGEMEFYNRIELYTYNYNTKTEMLSVTITASCS